MPIKKDIQVLGEMFHESKSHIAYQAELLKPFKENDWQKAITISEKYIKGNELDIYPYFMMASFYYSLENYSQAIVCCKKALLYDNKCSPAIKYLALSNNKLGNFKEAYFYANQAIKLYEEDPPKIPKIGLLIGKSFEFIINILSWLPKFKNVRGKSKEIVYQEFTEMKRFYDWSLRYIIWCKENHPDIINEN